MNLFVNDGRGFQRRYVEESFNRDVRIWEERRVPTRWRRVYQKPVVILTNGFAPSSVDVLRAPLDEDLNAVRALVRDLREEVERQFEFLPDLPPPRFVAREGGVEAWRKGEGHLVACRCNGCGQVHPSYWLETDRDVETSNEIERRHPAVTLLKRAIATFHGKEFVGCYCLAWEEKHSARRPLDPREVRRTWYRPNRWPAA